MTIQEFYARVGGDYNEVLRRLGNEALIKKVLGMLGRDKSMEQLREALKAEDYEAAFRSAHTLKGVVMNLGLAKLAEADSILTETLRSREKSDMIPAQMARVEECYIEAMAAIDELMETNTEKKEGDGSGPAQ